MNKEFVKKMVKAKRLEYEAIKEIMPDSIKNRIECFEKDAFDLIKDIAIEIIEEDMDYKSNAENNCDSKSVKKINVDFN